MEANFIKIGKYLKSREKKEKKRKDACLEENDSK